MTTNDNTILRRVRTNFDEKMYPSSTSSLSPENCKMRALCLWPARTVVPVIFIPGIMGTNLRNAKHEENAWVPPNGIREGVDELRTRKGQFPKDRQKQLTPDDCEVHDRSESVSIPDSYLALNPEEAKRRGWGEVHADSYLEILTLLEESLNYPFEGIEYAKPKPLRQWDKAMQPEKKAGQPHEQAWNPKEPLTEEELKNRMGKIYFPVYACGYNWLQSNAESAKTVVKRVEEIEARLKDHKYFSYSGKVILVTHSMGGLVARAAVKLLGEKVLGVVHGVQPVTGAPIVYRRFKAGTETGGWWDIPGQAAAVILGWDAADVTCLMANSPGPMELLPTKHYAPGWLHITDGEKTITLPKGDDPYNEIYTVSATQKWWGMVDPALIDPAGQYAKDDANIDPYKGGFLKKLGVAEDFHDDIQLGCHSNTYAYYGDDIRQQSAHKVVWRTANDLTSFSEEEILNAQRTKAALTGNIQIEIKGRKIGFKLDGKHGPGDGTVPTPSGEAVKKLEGIKDVYTLQGFDHQKSYGNAIARHTVLYAIGKMAQDIQLNEDGTCKS